MANENELQLTDQQRLQALEKSLNEQKSLLEQLQRREQELIDKLAQTNKQLNTPGITTASISTSNQNNNSAGAAEIDVRCLQLQPVINHYAHPIKSGDPEKWINWYEAATKEIRWADEKRAHNMVVYLDDQAAKWAINNKLTEWSAIKEAFIKHFRSLQFERSDFDTFKFHPRGNISKFVALKEEKANSAGIAEEEAVLQTVLNGKLPTIFAFQLADNLPKTFDELKRRLNRMVTIQQQQPSQESNGYGRSEQRQFYRPMAHYQQSQRNAPFPNRPYNRPHNNRSFNRQSPRPSTPCPNCKSRSIISYHWLTECRNRQNNDQNDNRQNNRPPIRPNQNKQVKTFEQQPQGDQHDTNQHPN